ncbi:T9SS type A sorting domain-containing protein [Altibacter sp. HG106]|uniref:T9SS type A sorting domain-containing protein n=1 Tax=Altibacter sp. HG106 TaxID=3023937 RepID=UPI00234FD354|nr:T9SS type A sorting domain-containing protein [Altibacter sp. HG106]MDC7993933.1 T9SS type A sorting domain-containing protein [Altibacter sp. HG106]
MLQKLLLFFYFFGMTTLLQAQVVAGIPDDLIECDVNNPGDQTEVFDLTETETQIINGQSNVVVSYHPTSGDALGNNNAFPNPENFTNTANPQLIFARLQSTNGQGWEVVSFQIIVPLIPVVENAPENLEIIEGDGDGEAIFDLTANESTVLGSQDRFLFLFDYYRSQEDADNEENVITTPEAFANESNPQTIYGRMNNLERQCYYEVFTFEISTDGSFGINDAFFDAASLEATIVASELRFQFSENTSEVQAAVHNVAGKTVVVSTLVGNRPTMSVTGLASGIYFLKLQKEGVSKTIRFIKQ